MSLNLLLTFFLKIDIEKLSSTKVSFRFTAPTMRGPLKVWMGWANVVLSTKKMAATSQNGDAF